MNIGFTEHKTIVIGYIDIRRIKTRYLKKTGGFRMNCDEIFKIPATKRVENLRKIYLSSPVATQKRPFYYSWDRWQSLYFLEGWLKYDKLPTTQLRRAYAEAYILEKSRPIISEDELIAGQLDYLPYTPEEQKRFDELNEMFKMSPFIDGRQDHMSLNYEKLITVGVRGLIDEIRARKSELKFDVPEEIAVSIEKEEFYDGCIVELEALLKLAVRYAGHARTLAQTAEPARSKELMEIADVFEHVPKHPARSFREALQSIHFYTYNLFGLYALGRPDQYLLSYYEADINAGRLTREEAQELIDNFCMLYSTYIFSRASVSIMVGGRDRAGNPVENELTYMFLNSISHIRMADPSVGLCITDQTSEGAIRCSLKLLAEGYTHPALFNDRVITDSLIRYGFSEEDAHEYVHTTCVEITACYKSNMWIGSPWVNLVKIFLDTIYENKEYADLEAIFNEFEFNVCNHMIKENRRFAYIQMERSRNGAEPLRVSCLIDDCIRRGKGIGQGGAVYNQLMTGFVGAANVVDSLAAIEILVYQEKKLTLNDFKDILTRDYKENEALRQYIIRKTSHYGNDEEYTDGLMIRLMKILEKSCSGLYTYRGTTVIPGAFSYYAHVDFGKATQATPDGRHEGEPLSDSAGAMQGRDVNGPTAAILSSTCWDQSVFLGGVAVNLKFNKEMMSGDALDNIAAIVKTYIQRGGLELQVNTVDNETLKDAMKCPERHRDLLVRVGGYSDYFVKLSEQLQREIIARTSHTV